MPRTRLTRPDKKKQDEMKEIRDACNRVTEARHEICVMHNEINEAIGYKRMLRRDLQRLSKRVRDIEVQHNSDTDLVLGLGIFEDTVVTDQTSEGEFIFYYDKNSNTIFLIRCY